MFSLSNTDSNAKQLWKLLGTFYENLPDSAKEQFQAYWEAHSRAVEASYYTLYQSDLLRYFKFTKGAHELLFKKYKLIFNDFDSLGRDLTNTTKEFLKTPSNVNVTKGASGTGVYSYRVSAVNDNGETLASEEVYVTAAAAPASSSISITWDAVTGANSYKVYGRSIKDQKLLKTVATNSFSDDGTAFENSEEIPKKVATALSYYLFQFPEDFLILSIPQLVQKSNGTTLTEGVEYSVQDLKFLKLDASLIDTNIDLGLNVEFNEYSADSIICLSPILSNLYFKIFGKTVPSTLILDSKYLPHLKDYDLLTFKEQQEKYADHLKFWTWAYSFHLRKAPTLSNIKKLYGLAQDFPFAYEGGLVTNVTSEFITISGENSYTYDIGDTNTHLFSQGESVERFDLLCSGVNVDDFYTNSGTMINLATTSEEPRLLININRTATFSPDSEITEMFKKIAIPAGIILKETTD